MAFNNRQLSIISIISYIIITLAQLSIGLYLPSFPTITHDLGATSSLIQLTLSIYMAGFGLSQLLYGPLSDRFGRKKIILIGVACYIVGSAVCALAPNIDCLLLGRLIQGLGVGCTNAITYAILRDVFSGNRYAKSLSILSMSSSVAAIIAPLFGGYIEDYLGWRFGFWILLIYSVLIAMAVLFILIETNLNRDLTAMRPVVLFKNYWKLLNCRSLLMFLFAAGITYSAILTINAMTPFIFEEQLHFRASIYGWLILIAAVGYMAGTIISSKTVLKLGMRKLVWAGMIIYLLAALAMLIFGFFVLNVYVVLIPIVVIYFGMGLSLPSCCGGVMQPFPDNAGSAAALLGFFMAFMSVVATIGVSFVHETNQIPMAIILIVIGILAMLAFCFSKPESNPSS